MSALLLNKMADSYFRLMKNWDIDTKRNLIGKLTKSINGKSKTKLDFSSSFGAWEDNRSADEISNDLRSDRTNHTETEDF